MRRPPVKRSSVRARRPTVARDAFHRALEGARETARFAPTQWRNQERRRALCRAAVHIDYAVRNARVLAPAARTAVEAGDAMPAGIVEAVRLLARASGGSPASSPRGGTGGGSIEATLHAAGRATQGVEERQSLRQRDGGQIRSIATDCSARSGSTGRRPPPRPRGGDRCMSRSVGAPQARGRALQRPHELVPAGHEVECVAERRARGERRRRDDPFVSPEAQSHALDPGLVADDPDRHLDAGREPVAEPPGVRASADDVDAVEPVERAVAVAAERDRDAPRIGAQVGEVADAREPSRVPTSSSPQSAESSTMSGQVARARRRARREPPRGSTRPSPRPSRRCTSRCAPPPASRWSRCARWRPVGRPRATPGRAALPRPGCRAQRGRAMRGRRRVLAKPSAKHSRERAGRIYPSVAMNSSTTLRQRSG